MSEQLTKIPLITNALIKEQEDYTQSANALFHFMNQMKFLERALVNKALIPRYCREDISYLNLNMGGYLFNEIAILQKCFCDIPLHKVATDFELMITEQSRNKLKSNEETDLTIGNNHPGCYGKFALAFSKRWCEEQKLQPIHYLNENSPYSKHLEEIIKSSFLQDELSDSVVLDIFQRLALLKPLRGKMKRFIGHGDKKIEIEIIKNFHDEQEWRFIPSLDMIMRLNLSNAYQIDPVIIANPKLINMKVNPGESYIDVRSNELENKNYNELWLKFEYDDIRYIIVPDQQSRLDIINYIMQIPRKNFSSNPKQERLILVSKILILEEIRKDW